jgi:hypoxanthine phosphoribosyltransferase
MNPDRIDLLGRPFAPLISEADILERLAAFAAELNAQGGGEPPLLVPVLSGAFRVFAELARLLTIPYAIDFVKLTSYGSGTSGGSLTLQLPLSQPIEGRRVVVIEDIVDTGRTSDFLHAYLLDRGAARVELYSLLFKPDRFTGQHPPTAYGFSIPPAFVVGFGLDYAEAGRWLRGIYALVE